jgi:hypothetical protein
MPARLMLDSRRLIVVAAVILSCAPAFAGEQNQPGTLAPAVTEARGNAVFSCGGCSGWVWTKVREAWRWQNGSDERIWVYILTGYTGDYADVSTVDARHKMMIEAAASAHWIAFFADGSGGFSDVRLWYN